MHHQEAGGNLPLTLMALKNDRAKCDRRMPDVFVKQTAERPETLEANLKADVGYGQAAG